MIPTGGPGPGSSLSLSWIICIQGEPLYSVQPGRIGLAHAFQTKKEEKEQVYGPVSAVPYGIHTAFVVDPDWQMPLRLQRQCESSRTSPYVKE
eukprot:764815-Hanusia_phi.AAC.1